MGNRIQVGLSLPDSLAATLEELERVQGVPVPKLAVRLLEAAATQFRRTGAVRLDQMFTEPAAAGEVAVGETAAPYGSTADFDARLREQIQVALQKALAETKGRSYKSSAAKAPRRAGAAAPLSGSKPHSRQRDTGHAAHGA